MLTELLPGGGIDLSRMQREPTCVCERRFTENLQRAGALLTAVT